MIDFSPFVADLLGVFQTVVLGILGVLAGAAVRWVLKKTNLDGMIQEDMIRNYLYTALENAVIFGVSQAKDKIGANVTIETKNEILAAAVNYVMSKVPDALAHFGLVDANAIRDLLVARLEAYLAANGDPAALPAPAPATPAA